jgi:hypothetical protein
VGWCRIKRRENKASVAVLSPECRTKSWHKIFLLIKNVYTILHDIKEDHRVTVFENSVLWRIFGPKRDEVTGG